MTNGHAPFDGQQDSVFIKTAPAPAPWRVNSR
jgi:hypothetical protein